MLFLVEFSSAYADVPATECTTAGPQFLIPGCPASFAGPLFLYVFTSLLRYFRASTIIAIPCPPPMHAVARP